jgi:hypothetical protein
MRARASQQRKEISAEDFPALREFLRGYFHEDMEDDYGSAVGAVEQFCQDSDPGQHRQVSTEWERLMRELKGQPIEELNRVLVDILGSSQTVSAADIRKISAALYRNDLD